MTRSAQEATLTLVSIELTDVKTEKSVATRSR